jgi:hypothetical protein
MERLQYFEPEEERRKKVRLKENILKKIEDFDKFLHDLG